MKVSRALLGVVGVRLAGSAIGHRSVAATAASPSVSIRRVTAILARTVVGDFNGDGFVDFAAAATGTPFPRPLAGALGRGDGTFGAPVSIGFLSETDNDPVLVYVGDNNRMIRESAAAGSKQVDAIVSPSKGIAMQYRSATNGATVSAAQVAGGVETTAVIDDIRIER